jgi:glucose/arabinose dehydrogenase
MRSAAALAVIGMLAGMVPVAAEAQLRSAVVATGLTNPIAFVVDPSDPSIFYVVEQRGTIRTFRNGTVSANLFLDLRSEVRSGGEQGLLGMAFAPGASTSGKFFVNFTDGNGDTVVARFRRDGQGGVDPASRFDLVWPDGRRVIEQPFDNHNGGHLAFGPDGYLYIGLGDGGSGGDPFNNAQNPRTLLGKMLRIDVNVPDEDPRGYQIPEDNPFVTGSPVSALPEVWAFGLRNPWRYSFDDVTRGGTGALVIGDVGQNSREEIDWEPRASGGRNYGWRLREGALPFDARQPAAFLPLKEPIHDYPRNIGQSVSGGFVYRGAGLPAMFNGRYFYADFVSGRVFSLGINLGADQEARAVDILELTSMLGGTSELGMISAFAVDGDAELYIVSYSRGRVLKIVPSSP